MAFCIFSNFCRKKFPGSIKEISCTYFSMDTFFVFWRTQLVAIYLSYLPMKQIWRKSAVCICTKVVWWLSFRISQNIILFRLPRRKNPATNYFQKLVKLTGHTYACNSLTNFKYFLPKRLSPVTWTCSAVKYSAKDKWRNSHSSLTPSWLTVIKPKVSARSWFFWKIKIFKILKIPEIYFSFFHFFYLNLHLVNCHLTEVGKM